MDELYFEEGYVEVGYFAKTLIGAASLASSSSVSFDGDIADTSGYYIPDYIDVGYYENGVIVTGSGTLSSSASFIVTATKVIQGAATITDAFQSVMTVNATRFVDSLMEIVFSLESTANKTVDPGATLANIANLSAQALKTVDFAAAAAAEFTLTADYLVVQFADSNMSSDFALTANAIEYRSKWIDALRPIDIEFTRLATFDSSLKKYGSYSLKLDYTGYAHSYPVENSSTFFTIPSNTAFVMESWVYFDTIANDMLVNVQPLLFGLGAASVNAMGVDDLDEITTNSTIGPVIGLQVINSAWRPKAVFNTSSGLTTLTSSASVNPNTWIHLALTRDSSGNLNLLVNNVSRASGVNTGSFTSLSDRISFKNNFDRTGGGAQVWFDGFTARINSNTISTYASYPLSTEDTLALYNFENNLLDDLAIQLQGAANLSGAFTPVVTVSVNRVGEIALASEFTINAVANYIVDNTASISSEFSQSSTENYLIPGAAVLSSSFVIAADGNVTRNAESNLSATVTQTADAVKTVDPDLEFAAIATQLTAAAKIGDFLIAADVAATLTIDVNAVFDTGSTQASEFSFAAEAIKSVVAHGEFESITALSADAVKQTDVTLNINSTATQLTTAVKTAVGSSTQSATVELAADPAGTIIRITSNLTSTATLNSNVERIQQGSSDLSSEFTQTVAAVLVTNSEATLAVETAATVINSRTRDTDIDMPAVASQLTAAAKIGDFLIAADVQAQLAIDPVVLAAGSVTIESVSIVNAVAVKNVEANSSQNSEFDITAAGTSNITGESHLVAVSVITTDATKTAVAQSQLTAALSIAILGTKTVSPSVELASAFNISASAARFRDNSGVFSSVFAQTALAGITAEASANLPAISTQLAVARELRIDQYVYIIPRETRTAVISRETRSHTIRSETRTYTIEGS